MGHTPGPWEVIQNPWYENSWDVQAANTSENIADDLSEANARLIAAAPELAALVESVEWTKTSDRWGNWDGYECPWCLCYTDKPENGVHAPDCPRQLALAKARGE